MRLALVSANVVSGQRLTEALAAFALAPSEGIVVPRDDRLAPAVVELCSSNAWPSSLTPSIVASDGISAVLAEPAILVITDGIDYTCAEVLRRARAARRTTYVYEVPWSQLALL